MKSKKIISFSALIISIFVHSVIFSIPAYLYYIKHGKTNMAGPKDQNKVYMIDASILPDIKVIGHKSSVKKVNNTKINTNESMKMRESNDKQDNQIASDILEETDNEMLVIYDYIKRKIQENKRYPYQAKKERIEGVVEMEFSITGSGLLKDVNIVKSSGYGILDDEAIKTIKRSAPYPEIQGRLNKEDLQLQVKLIYKIE